ncbi:hypothetical protein HDV05_000697 [Chytridiales sp. JEL 0842]|nr:hypothetical protein HDV05_000697 [Chytridiales sp. JEL 0842]
MQEVKDYYTQEEMVSFAKPKKRKKSKAKGRVKDRDEEDQDWPVATTSAEGDGETMDVDEVGNGGKGSVKAFAKSNASANIDDINFVDDDDLQEALSRARKVTLKKTLKMRPEDIANSVEQAALIEQEAEDDDATGGLVLSATSEFVNNLSNIGTSVKEPTPTPIAQATTRPPAASEAMDVDGEDSDSERRRQRGEDDDDEDDNGGWGIEEDEGRKSGGWHEPSKDTSAAEEEIAAIIVEEPLVNVGLASTLQLVKQKGLVEKVTPEQLERERKQKEKNMWLAEQRLKDAKREAEKAKEKKRAKEALAKSGGKHQQQHQQDDYSYEDERMEERKRARELEEKFKNYTPDVELKYHDEYGRSLNQKEAFRLLSHKFHGKTSGKMKTEKKLRKMEEEVKLQQMLSSDSPLSTGTEKTKLAQTAHVVLSVGNRGVLPAEMILAEASAMRKAAKASNKDGGKSSKSKTGGSGAPLVVQVDTTAAMPVGVQREKVAFGIATKRKVAGEDGGFEESLAKKPHL